MLRIECIREWRTSHNGNDGTTSPFSEHPGQPNPKKTCPMCRKPSDFVVPSSVFPTPPEHAETAKAANNAEAGSDQNDSRPSKPKNHMKEKIIATYLEKLKKIPCRYFEEGIRRWRTRTASSSSAVPFRPMCFFGNRCHYAHTQPISGEPYVFSDQELVVIEEVRAEQRASSHGVPHPSLDPSMLENMVETFGVLFGMELPAMFGAEMGPPPLGAPAILRALQEESLRQMGYAIDSDEDGDEWEDYDTGEEDDSDDDDDLPELIPFEVDSDDGDDDLPELISFQVDGTSANTGNDGDAGFEDMPGLIPLEADVSDEDYGDMPGLIPLETDALDEDYGDMPGLIPRDVDSANDGNDDYSGGTPNLMDLISFSIGSDNDSDEPPDLIELDT